MGGGGSGRDDLHPRGGAGQPTRRPAGGEGESGCKSGKGQGQSCSCDDDQKASLSGASPLMSTLALVTMPRPGARRSRRDRRGGRGAMRAVAAAGAVVVRQPALDNKRMNGGWHCDHPQAGRQPDSPDVAAASKAVWHASNRSPAAPMRDLSLLVIVVSRCSLLCGEHKHAGQHQQCIPRKQPCLGRRTNNGEQLAQRGRPAPPCSSAHIRETPSLEFMDNTPDTRTQGRVEPLSIEGLEELGGKQCKATRRRHLMAGIATDCE